MSRSTNENLNDLLTGQNAAFLEQIYDDYIADPSSVDPQWQQYFDQLQDSVGSSGSPADAPAFDTLAATKQGAVARLISTYRAMGHKGAKIDPIGTMPIQDTNELTLAYHDLSDSDLDTMFDTGPMHTPDRLKLRDIVDFLEHNYSGSIGFEYGHISESKQRRWIRKQLERSIGDELFKKDEKLRILDRLTASEGMEKYLHTKYVGQKRFSIEGGESLIPILDELVQKAGQKGINEVVMGMAHRGRLNVLINVMGKSPAKLFAEFEGNPNIDELAASGDVKYHQGFSSDIQTEGGPVHLSLAFNPSHLEIVSPVVSGSVRARQDRRGDDDSKEVLPITIHGDAAFAGQGVVMETFQMSGCRGYKTGGTIRIVINNQVGFTTDNLEDTRSTAYCTEIAKIVEAPIFHVNGDDPEAVVFATRIALDYRMKFGKDVIIDLVCYRRHGHNESDEPSVTQPQMYQTIKAHPTTRRIYAQKLIDNNTITAEQEQAMVQQNRQDLVAGKRMVNEFLETSSSILNADWEPFLHANLDKAVDTAVKPKRLKQLIARVCDVPEHIKPHNRAAKIVSDRQKMGAGDLPLDWGMAETLAYASLLDDNYTIRISGQDSGRGTFFHRHAEIHNTNQLEVYTPLQHVADNQPKFSVYNSLLSEEAVLAFEYGYSCARPNTLTIWEAQFGDFANGAQVVIDQFISSGEAKWGRLSGLTMFLPHGYEGQGPEHSSARLERYMQLCAQNNMQVCYPSTPAQFFHMIRRQMVGRYRKPLIVMTPKSLLRHKLSTSSLAELQQGEFQKVIPEIDKLTNKNVKRILLCSGKVFYDLVEHRRANDNDEVVILRIEQLYPFPTKLLRKEINKYKNATEIVWCQEEPRNQGAFYSIAHHLRDVLGKNHKLHYVGREPSASPAAGYAAVHNQQQQDLVKSAFTTMTNASLYS